jgi:hypothetical protein
MNQLGFAQPLDVLGQGVVVAVSAAKVNAPGEYANTATISGLETDPDQGKTSARLPRAQPC